MRVAYHKKTKKVRDGLIIHFTTKDSKETSGSHIRELHSPSLPVAPSPSPFLVVLVVHSSQSSPRHLYSASLLKYFPMMSNSRLITLPGLIA